MGARGWAAALAGARGESAERARGVARRQPVGMDDQEFGGAAAQAAGDERTQLGRAAAARAQGGDDAGEGIEQQRHGPALGRGGDCDAEVAAEEVHQGEEHGHAGRKLGAILRRVPQGGAVGFGRVGCGMNFHLRNLH